MCRRINLKAMRRAAKRDMPEVGQYKEDERARRKAALEQARNNARLAAVAAARETAKVREAAGRLREGETQKEAAAATSAAARLLAAAPLVAAAPYTPETKMRRPSRRPSRRLAPRPVWGNSYQQQKSYMQLSAEKREARRAAPPPQLALDAFMNGVVLARAGDTFRSCGLLDDPFARSPPWRKMASQLVANVYKGTGRVASVHSGSLNLEKVGAGTFNLVVRMREGDGNFALPSWMHKCVSDALGRDAKLCDVVLRVTRGDSDEYATLHDAAGEAQVAMFACMNDIGQPLFAVAPLQAPRATRSARYASVHVLQAAHTTLGRALDVAPRREDGVQMGVKMTELLFEASALGVLFADVKPLNVLLNKTARGLVYRLADPDPQFFLLLDPERRDWRALMLANLSLLAAHVRNMRDASEATRGFCLALKPVLRELLDRRLEYNCGWLFETRSVLVELDNLKGHEDFELQRLFCSMSGSYFYGREAAERPSGKWRHWDRTHQAELDAYWKAPANVHRWPDWSRPCTPLVEQLVDFATVS